ncbi:MAG TPA: YraN family protein [Bryobacteraceae bacterium]|nr:YraN family protein [Bryobacteraceae bacterium]
MIGALFDQLRDVRRRRLWDRDLAAGRRGEDLAHRFLRKQGYIIVARNYRLSSGEAEADLIAREGDALVIVEVKTRATEEYGPPERAVNPEKQRHLLRVAREYARKTGTPWEHVRFDVVSIVLREPPEITVLRAAFR